MTQISHKPVRIRLRRTGGWRLPADAVSVARPHRWGNPYKAEDYGLAEAIRLFEAALMNGNLHSTRSDTYLTVDDSKRELRGKLLACWCQLDEACHADVLLRIANEDEA